MRRCEAVGGCFQGGGQRQRQRVTCDVRERGAAAPHPPPRPDPLNFNELLYCSKLLKSNLGHYYGKSHAITDPPPTHFPFTRYNSGAPS